MVEQTGRFANEPQQSAAPTASRRFTTDASHLQSQQQHANQQLLHQQQQQQHPRLEVLLVTGGYDQTVRFWDVQSGAAYRVVQHTDGQINTLASTNDKELVATGGYSRIRMYETRSAKNTHDFEFTGGIGKNVTQVGFHADARWLYSSAEDGIIRIYDLQSNSPQPVKVFRNECPVNCITLHPNQTTLFFGDQDGIVHIWDLRTDWRLQYVPEKGSSIQGIDVDLEGVYLACVTSKGSCQLWSLSNVVDQATMKPRGLQANKKNSLFQVHSSYALKCRFSPDSTLLATTSADKTVKVWRTADLSLTATLADSEQRWVWDAAFTADSQHLFTASSDGIVRLWQLEGASGAQFSSPVVKKQYHGHSKAVVAMAFRDDAIV